MPGSAADRLGKAIDHWIAMFPTVNSEQTFLELVHAARKLRTALARVGFIVKLGDPEGWTTDDEARLVAMDVLQS